MERLLQQLCLMGIEVNQYRSTAIHAHHFKEADCLKQLDDALHDLYLLIKAGFNPNQPRVPSGNPTGGQWAEVGAVSGNDTVELVKTILPPSGKRLNRANIFVGGGGEQDLGTRNVRNSGSLNRYTYGDNYYATHDAHDGIRTLIRSLPKGRQLNLIGHSYGGDTAADIATEFPKRVHTLITIDPVSINRPDFEKVSGSVRRWINVFADDYTPSLGNFLSFVGQSWGDLPKDHADLYIEAPYQHEAFDRMMYYRSSNSDKSPQQLLNED